MDKKQTALLALLLYQCSAQAHEDPDINKIETNLLPKIQVVGRTYQPSTIDERLAHYKVPGISVAVVKDGKLAWAKGYGIANKKTRTNVGKNTLFQAGSISKPIAALAALKLVQDKKVNLDTDVNQYLTSWKIPNSSYTKQQAVTLRHLLTHTAGTTVHGFPGYHQDEKLPSNSAVLSGQGNTAKVIVDQTPGSHWRYSGGGYTVMEQLVEDVSKQPFDKFLHDEVLLPIKMIHSTFEQPLPKSKWSLASAAFNQAGEQIEGDWNNYPEQAAAGLWTTPSDLANYILAIQQARKGSNSELLSKDSVNEMLTTHQGNWGLGPNLSKHKQGLVFGHGGKNAGFTNDLIAYADNGNGIIIMSNGDSAGPLISEIKVAISTHYQWDLATTVMLTPAKLSPELNASIVGSYSYDAQPEYKVTVTITDGKIEVYDPDTDEKLSFLATSKDSITNLNSGSVIQFDSNKKGELTGLTWAESHKFSKISD